jgi:hypothetical protein
MGALIASRGTQRLVKHYNKLFNFQKLKDTRKIIIQNQALKDLFTNPSAAGATPILDITEFKVNNKKIFLPDDSNDHPHLLKRWRFFLGQPEFSHDNQEKLRGFLAHALNLQSGETGPTGTNERGDHYGAIHFDCVEAKSPQTQTVLQSDEYKLKGNSEDDDTGMVKAKAFSMIVLVTEPIKNAPDQQDDQKIQ